MKVGTENYSRAQGNENTYNRSNAVMDKNVNDFSPQTDTEYGTQYGRQSCGRSESSPVGAKKSDDGVAGYRMGDSGISIRRNCGYSANSDLARIAAARSIQEVKSISRYVEFKMTKVKKSGASRSEIKATLRQMEKVIGKAKKKAAGLKKEEQLKAQEKSAEKAHKEQLRRRRQEEYEAHKRKRQAKERNDAATPHPTSSQGAKRIAEEAYRKAMEQITHSGGDEQAYGQYGAQSCELTGGTVDLTAGDMTTVSGGVVVDAAGAVVDMML